MSLMRSRSHLALGLVFSGVSVDMDGDIVLTEEINRRKILMYWLYGGAPPSGVGVTRSV